MNEARTLVGKKHGWWFQNMAGLFSIINIWDVILPIKVSARNLFPLYGLSRGAGTLVGHSVISAHGSLRFDLVFHFVVFDSWWSLQLNLLTLGFWILFFSGGTCYVDIDFSVHSALCLD